MGLLLAYVGIALGVSFLCSLLEATLLATRNGNLLQQSNEGNRGAAHLLALKQGRVDDAISAILILNTVSNTLGATMAGAQASRVFGSNWVGVFSGVLTLAILVVSEIIPKTLGATYPKQLAGFCGWTLYGLTRAMAPALLISRALTQLLTRGRSVSISRAEVAAVITTAADQGTLSDQETQMLENLLQFNEVQVEDVMTPHTVVFTMACTATIDDFLADSSADVFSRIPLYDGDQDNIVGYVLKMEVLTALAKGIDRSTPLSQFQRDITFLPELATVGKALAHLLRGHDAIAMVTDEHGKITGIVSLEDLTETALGVEIVDESDRIADMRVLAARLRDQRLRRMRRKRQLPLEKSRVAATTN